MDFYLAKTDFDKFLVHPAYLWLKKHQKHKLPPVDEALQFRFDQGHEFEAIARQLFPEGELVDAKPWEFDYLVDQTQTYLDQDQPVIFQATFKTKRDLLCKVDILVKTDQGWDIYEVKSGSSVRDKYLEDVTFQVIALEAAGLTVNSQHLIIVNNNYQLEGELDPEGLTSIQEVTQDVAEIKTEVASKIEQALKVAKSAERPSLSPAKAKRLRDWWEVFFHIKGDLPDDSIYYLRKANQELLAALEKQNIEKLSNIDLESTDLEFNKPQELQIKSAKKQEPIIKPKPIQNFLEKLEYPLYFLDYETVGHVVPLFEDTQPNQHVPFEYSLHIQSEPGAELDHFEFVAQAVNHQLPSQDLLEHMAQHIGKQGSVIVWYDRFEKGRNNDMTEWHPEYADMLENVNERIVDLRDPFAKHNYVDWRFKGSTSLKNVLPVLAPELSYDELDVSEGMAALLTWHKLFKDEIDEKIVEKTYQNLRDYCALDTLAMVRILEKLYEAAEDNPSQEPAASKKQQTQLF